MIKKELTRREIKAQQLPFSNNVEISEGAFCQNDSIQLKIKEDVMSVFTDQLTIQGQHNRYNTMAAGIVARLFQIRKPIIRESLSNFRGVEHRLERVFVITSYSIHYTKLYDILLRKFQ